MKGIVVFYINFHPELNQDQESTIRLVKEANKELFAKIQEGMEYQIMVVPCTKEGCRVEKIDFDKPFPRFVPKTQIDQERIDKIQEQKLKEGVSQSPMIRNPYNKDEE